MSSRNLIILALAALIASLLAWYFSDHSFNGGGGDGGINSGQLLFPDFRDYANDIDRIQIFGAGEELLVEMRRDQDQWQVVQKDHYPADWGKVRQLLRQLGEARVVATKTSRKALYPKLGVADIGNEDTGGGLVRWGDDGRALIIGIRAGNIEGRYVRKPGEAQSYLVDQVLDVPARPRDWLDRDLIDWQGSRIASITIRHADGGLVRIGRSSEDALEMQLENIPAGRELKGQWMVNGVVNALTGLKADDVHPVEGPAPADATRVLYVTDNGINLVLSLYTRELPADEESAEAGTEYLLRAEASLEPGAGDEQPAGDSDSQGDEAQSDDPADDGEQEQPAAQAGDDPADDGEQEQPAAQAGDDDDGDAVNAAAGDEQQDRQEDPAAEVERLNRRLAGWEFVIPQYKYNALNKRLEDLLKPLPEESEDGNAATAPEALF